MTSLFLSSLLSSLSVSLHRYFHKSLTPVNRERGLSGSSEIRERQIHVLSRETMLVLASLLFMRLQTQSAPIHTVNEREGRCVSLRTKHRQQGRRRNSSFPLVRFLETFPSWLILPVIIILRLVHPSLLSLLPFPRFPFPLLLLPFPNYLFLLMLRSRVQRCSRLEVLDMRFDV